MVMNSLHIGNGKILKTSLVILIGALSLGGCATTTIDPATTSKVDPYEGVNRDMFAFNQ